MKNNISNVKETVLNLYFEKGISKEDILKEHLIGANTLDFWVNEKLGDSAKKNATDSSSYQSEADDDYHIFLKKEPLLLDMPHYHESIELICMLTGSATAHIGEHTFRVSAGDICFADTYRNHFYENQSDDLEALCLVLSHTFTHHYRQFFKNKTPPYLMRNGEYNKRIFFVVKKWLDEKDKSFLLNCSYANKLFDEISKTYGLNEIANNDNRHMAIKFIDYVEKNYRSNISLLTMANYFGYTKEYCSKLFNRVVGQHFKTFLNTVRIHKAEEMLNSKDGENKKINDVLYECGFNNPVTFYRYYKKTGK